MLEAGWNTRGWSNDAEGVHQEIVLVADPFSLRPGERRSVGFAIAAPVGPRPYRGRNFSVARDWERSSW